MFLLHGFEAIRPAFILVVAVVDVLEAQHDEGPNSATDGKDTCRIMRAQTCHDRREGGEETTDKGAVAERGRGEEGWEASLVANVGDVEGTCDAKLHPEDEKWEDPFALMIQAVKEHYESSNR